MGSLAENMTQVLNGRGKPRGRTTWIVTGVMALVVVVTVTWATLFIRYVSLSFLLQRLLLIRQGPAVRYLLFSVHDPFVYILTSARG